jgi:hypothetical protein
MADAVMVNCPHCRGRGEREQPVFSGRFDDAHVAVFECDVCRGEGKIDVLEEPILSAEPPTAYTYKNLKIEQAKIGDDED